MMLALARGGGRLHDAARPAPHHGRGPPLRPRALGEPAGRAPTGRPSTTTAPTRAASASIARRPAATRCRSTSRPSRERFGSLRRLSRRRLPALVPPRARGTTGWPRAARCGTSCAPLHAGVDAVRRMQATWRSLAGRVDARAPRAGAGLLAIQEQEARWWRDACVLYFQTFSKRADTGGLREARARPGVLHEGQQEVVPGI